MDAMKGAFAFLQKIGRSLMLPVSVLPAAGILLGVGSAKFAWLPEGVSTLMAQAGGAVFTCLPLIFAIAVAIGLTENDGVSCLAAVVGHCYPVWYGFRGGKGAATAVGALLVIEPLAVVPMLVTWLVVLVLTGWVGLGTMLAAISLIPAMLWLDAPDSQVVFAILLAAFIVFTHRSTIRNMRD